VAELSLLSARQKEILRRLGSGQQVLLPADFSTSPDRLTRVVAFQTIVADVDVLYRGGNNFVARERDGDCESGFFVVELYIDGLTPFGKDVVAIYGTQESPFRVFSY